MNYRIVEMDKGGRDGVSRADIASAGLAAAGTPGRGFAGLGCASRSKPSKAKEIAHYEDAYLAMEEMKRAFFERGQKAPPWYLFDPWGHLIMGPEDLYEFAADV